MATMESAIAEESNLIHCSGRLLRRELGRVELTSGRFHRLSQVSSTFDAALH